MSARTVQQGNRLWFEYDSSQFPQLLDERIHNGLGNTPQSGELHNIAAMQQSKEEDSSEKTKPNEQEERSRGMREQN
jgi:hypothetical protein